MTDEEIKAVIEQLTATAKQLKDAPGSSVADRSRMSEAADCLREAVKELSHVLADHTRIAAVPAEACRMEWGVCPDHGATVTTSGGRTWCRIHRCPRTFPAGYADGPCPEPIAYQVTDSSGATAGMCVGHALAARHNPFTFDPPLPEGTVAALDLIDSLEGMRTTAPRRP